MPEIVVNALVPFATRLADDGLVHVRAWNGPGGGLALVAELDWAIMVEARDDAYFGPGIYTYPDYALDAALEPCRSAGLHDPTVVVRLPDPPGERLLKVIEADDPQGWEPVAPDHVSALAGGADIAGPPPGAYVRRVVEAWVRSGALPA